MFAVGFQLQVVAQRFDVGYAAELKLRPAGFELRVQVAMEPLQLVVGRLEGLTGSLQLP